MVHLNSLSSQVSIKIFQVSLLKLFSPYCLLYIYIYAGYLYMHILHMSIFLFSGAFHMTRISHKTKQLGIDRSLYIYIHTHTNRQSAREKVWLRQTRGDRKRQTERIASLRHTGRKPKRWWGCHGQNTAWIFSSQIKITKYQTKKKKEVAERERKKIKYSWKHQWDKCPPLIPH